MDRTLIVHCALISLTLGTGHMQQRKAHRGLVVFVGKLTEMDCQLGRHLNVSSWVYTSLGKTQVTLYSVEVGLNRNVTRLELSDKADKLSISGTQLEDAGMYGCKALYPDVEGNHIIEEVVDLVVLGGEPDCSSSLSDSIEEGVDIQVRCSVSYRGDWAPEMIWRQQRPNTVVDGAKLRITATNHSATLILQAAWGIHKSRYTCTTHFGKYVGSIHTANVTAPHYNYTWTSPELNVKYSPRQVVITPDGYSHYEGEELTCSADSNPGATYEWKDLSSGRVFNGASIILDESMTNQEVTHLMCTATNDISNSSLTVSIAVTKALLNPKNILLVAVPSSVLLVILIAAIVVVYLRWTKRTAADCKEAKSPAGKPCPIEAPHTISDPGSTESNSYTSISSLDVSPGIEADETTVAVESTPIEGRLYGHYNGLETREIPLPVVYSRLENYRRSVPGYANAAAKSKRSVYVNINEQSAVAAYCNIETLTNP